MPHHLNFDWLQMRIALEGDSPLDLPRLNVKDKLAAKKFLQSYGYDYDDSVTREELWRIYFEALSFIQNHLLSSDEKVPSNYLSRGSHTDILRLMIDASLETNGRHPDHTKRGWACAILRIMHLISHLDNDVRLASFQYAREQIFDRLDKVIVPSTPRRWKVGNGKDSITLIRYIKKQRKERGSLIIKLLSKPEALAEGIYDSLGIRLVTQSRFDCYLLLQKLFELGVISPANIQPHRSTNTLIPFSNLKDFVEDAKRDLNKGALSPQTLRRRIQKFEQDHAIQSLSSSRNPFTSKWYRSIQFTGRQLIVAPDPTFSFWTGLKEHLSKSKSTMQALKKIPITIREKQSFYFPFEIQIMDIESYVESIGGRSRHREYKAKQRLMARNRVLRDLI